SDGVIRRQRAVTTKPRRRLSGVVPPPALPAGAYVATEESGDLGLLEKVERWLVEAVGVLLKVKREDVDLDAELIEFGFDSCSLTGFANYVNQAYDLGLMPTIFFEHPTVRRLARYLVEEHGGRLAEKYRPEARVAPAVIAARELEKERSESEPKQARARSAGKV